MQDTDLLTLNEMAEILKIKRSWLYAHTRETGPGTIPRIKVGKYIRFMKEDVMNWLKKQNEANS
jgi:excisionase family DNA binding protein